MKKLAKKMRKRSATHIMLLIMMGAVGTRAATNMKHNLLMNTFQHQVMVVEDVRLISSRPQQKRARIVSRR
jgi:hypothetical protein